MVTIDFAALFMRSPNPYVLIDRELHIVAANLAYLAVTESDLQHIIGRYIFDAFPNDPDDPNNESIRRLKESFERVITTGQSDAVPAVGFRVGADEDASNVRYWSATHTPLFDASGNVEYVLQHTVDITDIHLARERAADITAANQAGAQVLRRAENVARTNLLLDVERRHLRRLFEQAPVFVCFLRGPEHVFELTNPAYLKLVGHRDVIGRSVREAIPEAESQGFLKLLDKVFTSAEAFVGRGIPIMLEPSPGAPLVQRYLDFTYEPIVETDGSVSGIFVVGSDMTEQRQAASERERLATIVEQTGDFIGAADMLGRLLFVNDAGQKMLGISDERLGTIASTEFFFPEDMAFVMSTIAPALMSSGRWRGDMRMRHFSTGEAIPVDYHVFAIRDPASNEMTGVASVTRDLRGLQRLVATAAAAENDYRFLTNAIPVQIWTATPSGEINFVNQRVLEYFERTEADVLASGWPSGLHPDDVERSMASWDESVRTGQLLETEFRLRRAADQTYRWHIARAVARRNAHGAIEKWYGTNTDIEESKRTASERDSLIEALEASNKELKRFAYVASHDLKTPLRGIGNIAQWLEEDLADRLDDQTRSHLTLLRGRVQRMDALIDGVLKYSRASEGIESIQEVHVRELLEVVVDLLAPTEDVSIDVVDDMPLLHTAYVALQQVFLNLIGNSIKHAHREDVRITVGVTSEGDFHRFAVTDNGRGIDAAHHDRIWGLFQTLDSPNTNASTGIGLSMVKRIVETRGGKVSVDSRLGHGSTFYFTWPKRDPEQRTVRHAK